MNKEKIEARRNEILNAARESGIPIHQRGASNEYYFKTDKDLDIFKGIAKSLPDTTLYCHGRVCRVQTYMKYLPALDRMFSPGVESIYAENISYVTADAGEYVPTFGEDTLPDWKTEKVERRVGVKTKKVEGDWGLLALVLGVIVAGWLLLMGRRSK